jgi:hypothetical protein
MRRRLAALTAAAALAGVLPPLAPAGSAALLGPSAAVAKSCSRGQHAVIGGAHKCLARGQFCARGQDRAYHRYGFHCHKRDARGGYHLT